MFACLLASMLGGLTLQAKPLQDLHVLYLGKPGTERGNEFRDFLKPNLGAISVADRDQFKSSDAAGFDVVLLDWPQAGASLDKVKTNPLGKRSQWHKPTVLLGSAGLRTAVTWQVRGGIRLHLFVPIRLRYQEPGNFPRAGSRSYKNVASAHARRLGKRDQVQGHRSAAAC